MNVDFSPALLLGMSLIAGGLALYQLRRLQPDISRDFDVIVSAVATFSGGILIFQVITNASSGPPTNSLQPAAGDLLISCAGLGHPMYRLLLCNTRYQGDASECVLGRLWHQR